MSDIRVVDLTQEKTKLPRKAIGLFTILLFLVWAFFSSLTASINVPTFHLDGAFQTASGLFRLDAGQFPGKNFFPYLGIGPLLSLYPAFKILGANLAASVFSAQFMTLVLSWISVSILWQLVFRPGSLISSFAGGAFIFATPIFVSSYLALPDPFILASNPGNSLKPIRASAPYLVAITYYLLITKPTITVFRDAVAGVATGAIMLWSNDFAIPTAGLSSIFFGSYLYLMEKSTWLKSFAIYLCTAFFSGVLFITLTTLGHPFKLFKYNFVDVVEDQWWYFPFYGEYGRVFEFGQILRLVSEENQFPLVVLVAIIIAAIKTKKTEHALLAWIGLVLLAGGSLASLGGHLGGYFGGFYIWGMMTTILVFLRLTELGIRKAIKSHFVAVTLIDDSLHLVIVLALLIGSIFTWRQHNRNFTSAKSDPNRFYVTKLGGYLGVEWKEYISQAVQSSDKNVIEEYWGIWSSLTRRFPPWPVDSVIHAFGQIRNIAKTSLKNADLIITTRYATSPEWQPWSVSQNFWFYDDLLSGWHPETLSPTTIIWKKLSNSRARTDIECDVSENKRNFIVKSDAKRVYKVRIEYHVSEPGRYLLMVRNNISFGSDAGGYVSVSPYESNVTIPALITRDSGNVFDTKVVGSERAAFDIESCTAQIVDLDNEEVLHVRKVP